MFMEKVLTKLLTSFFGFLATHSLFSPHTPAISKLTVKRGTLISCGRYRDLRPKEYSRPASPRSKRPHHSAFGFGRSISLVHSRRRIGPPDRSRRNAEPFTRN